MKGIICIWGIAFGTYPLGPRLSGLRRVADEQGLAALTHPPPERRRVHVDRSWAC
jgi:hypothetical protein